MDLDIEQVRRLGPFSYDWPDATQWFEGGWEFLAAVGDQRFRVRHATGYTDTYGRRRVHSVTFVRGEPVVEGVAADDYVESYGLLSLLRQPGSQRHVRDHPSVPDGYAEFELVFHDEEIRAPYSPQSLAVKIREDDLRAWAAHALLRRGQARRHQEPGRGAAQAARHLADHGEPLDPERRAAVVAGLLRFGDTLDERYAKGFALAREPEADALLASDPFAFLIAVIADQGVVAERAWRLPLELRRRLGHLDLQRIVAEPRAVQTAVATEPALHRYVEKVPRWIVVAASRVLSEYGGDSARIWSDRPTAATLFRRLDDFPGVGQKKAAMAVELLERLLRVPITHLEGSDIAYDVHVRRVFLRTGLARYDDAQHMIEVARDAHPARPGALDGPAWEIGRSWCHPTGPDCLSCVLADPCPRFVDRASGVSGA